MSCVYKDEFIKTILNIMKVQNFKPPKVYLVDDIDLNKFAQKEGEKHPK